MSEKENQRDKFTLSEGNLIVLENIPRMMKNKKFRCQLRGLVWEFLAENSFAVVRVKVKRKK